MSILWFLIGLVIGAVLGFAVIMVAGAVKMVTKAREKDEGGKRKCRYSLSW